MEAGPASEDSSLMDRDTFIDNFSENMKNKTYLCYELKVFEGDTPNQESKFKGYLKNEDAPWCRQHAELCLLDRISSWELDQEGRYRVTCFISWSPCYDCAQELVQFLGRNPNVTMRIVAIRIYYSNSKKHNEGLRDLDRAGAQISIMTSEELEYCWETFVDHQEQPFQPWFNIDQNYQRLTQMLENILKGN